MVHRTGRLYTYVGSDPLDRTDPTGKQEIMFLGKLRRILDPVVGVAADDGVR